MAQFDSGSEAKTTAKLDYTLSDGAACRLAAGIILRGIQDGNKDFLTSEWCENLLYLAGINRTGESLAKAVSGKLRKRGRKSKWQRELIPAGTP